MGFKQTCANINLLSIHTYIYIYIYMCVCVCVYVCVCVCVSYIRLVCRDYEFETFIYRTYEELPKIPQ